MRPQLGDAVRVWRWEGQTRRETTGVIEQIRKLNPMRREGLVNGNWYILRSDLRNGVEIIKKAGRKRTPPM
ncbi:MAG: hypothetical protein HYR70_04130 [Chloroflexi bacterium]|nr:hypothetical protein [Chloroflexota bacterium]MBI3340744.1 hypothetical protein [Chloroflexota bacterium]